MKQRQLLYLLSILLFTQLTTFYEAHGQKILTVREVFDFQVGDEFHYQDLRSTLNSLPHGVVRKTVASVHYSSNQDTVFYSFHEYNYRIDIELLPKWRPVRKSYRDTTYAFYTNLDSLITYNFPREDTALPTLEVDSIIEISQELCEKTINGYLECRCGFEPTTREFHYGEGLGVIFEEYGGGVGGNPAHRDSYKNMVYYKKGEVECGEKEWFGLGVNQYSQNNNIQISPNPTNNSFKINFSEIQGKMDVEIINILGRSIMVERNYQMGNTLNIQHLPTGVYTLVIHHSKGKYTKSLIKN